jgi:hypothetical protein
VMSRRRNPADRVRSRQSGRPGGVRRTSHYLLSNFRKCRNDFAGEQLHILQQLACGFTQHDDAQVFDARAHLERADLVDHVAGAAKQIAGGKAFEMLILTLLRVHGERPSPVLTALQFLNH